MYRLNIFKRLKREKNRCDYDMVPGVCKDQQNNLHDVKVSETELIKFSAKKGELYNVLLKNGTMLVKLVQLEINPITQGIKSFKLEEVPAEKELYHRGKICVLPTKLYAHPTDMAV